MRLGGTKLAVVVAEVTMPMEFNMEPEDGGPGLDRSRGEVGSVRGSV